MNWSLLYLASEWAIRFVMLVYVPQRRSPAASRAWLLFIFLLPWPGLLVYAVFGRAYLPKRRLERQRRVETYIREAQAKRGAAADHTATLPADVQGLAATGRDLGGFGVTRGNAVELLPDYSGAIDSLVADIEASRTSAHLLFYIFEEDGTGRRVADALVRASKRGVSCRVIMDALGSKNGLKKLAPVLRAGGVEVQVALPVSLIRRYGTRFDLRNHRKIAVLDGLIGYAGSENIVDGRFVKGHPNEELWARVRGPVVLQLQAVFLADYYFETGTALDAPELLPDTPEAGGSPCQVVPSGPSFRRENGKDLIIEMLYTARERVVMTTPYFIPDEVCLEAICAAARRGVEVRLVVSMHANQPLSQLAQRACYEDLLEAGVAVHLYEPRFLHAKHITVDAEVALIGSTNMDIRSFALNEEVNLLIYDPAVVAQVRAVQERYFQHSVGLSPSEWAGRSLWAKVLQNSARLTDSLL